MYLSLFWDQENDKYWLIFRETQMPQQPRLCCLTSCNKTLAAAHLAEAQAVKQHPGYKKIKLARLKLFAALYPILTPNI